MSQCRGVAAFNGCYLEHVRSSALGPQRPQHDSLSCEPGGVCWPAQSSTPRAARVPQSAVGCN